MQRKEGFFFFFLIGKVLKRDIMAFIYIYIYISKNLLNNKENNAPMYTGNVLQ